MDRDCTVGSVGVSIVVVVSVFAAENDTKQKWQCIHGRLILRHVAAAGDTSHGVVDMLWQYDDYTDD